MPFLPRLLTPTAPVEVVSIVLGQTPTHLQVMDSPHNNKRGHQCKICEKVPFHKDSLKEHTDIHTTIEKELQPASVDENESSPNPFRPGSLGKTTLTQHKASEISHSKPHVCQTRAKSFSKVPILNNDKKTHEDKCSS